ncbi:spore protein [Paenibacillus sp. MAHUQ-46]|uniref:Spore protein n=1 Tax=Paenibacillus roseus TaxID=2798579 RepID=A0A934MQ62_9BACL|nr:spore protein [Paenibacillus roseus]MBJ6362816.1 spore protein [Paenibacillus roseus]
MHKNHSTSSVKASESKKNTPSGEQPEQEGFDKKLDGPNRPST